MPTIEEADTYQVTWLRGKDVRMIVDMLYLQGQIIVSIDKEIVHVGKA